VSPEALGHLESVIGAILPPMRAIQARAFVHPLAILATALVLPGCTEPPVTPTQADYYRVSDQAMNSFDSAEAKHWLRQFTSVGTLYYAPGTGLHDENEKQLDAILLSRGLGTLHDSEGYILSITTTERDNGVDVLLTLWSENGEVLRRTDSIAATDKRKAAYNLQVAMADGFSIAWHNANHLGIRKMPRLETFLKL
jgi:hypothetical protein